MYLNNAFARYATFRLSFSNFCKHWVQIKIASTVAVTNHNVKSKASDTNMASKTLQDDMLVPKDGGFQVRKYLYQYVICACNLNRYNRRNTQLIFYPYSFRDGWWCWQAFYVMEWYLVLSTRMEPSMLPWKIDMKRMGLKIRTRGLLFSDLYW